MAIGAVLVSSGPERPPELAALRGWHFFDPAVCRLWPGFDYRFVAASKHAKPAFACLCPYPFG